MLYNDTNDSQNFSVLASLLAGSLAGAVTVLLTQPMDNIVTRIQVGSSEGSAYYRCRQRYCSMVYSTVMEQLSNHRMLCEYEKSILPNIISLSFTYVMLMLFVTYMCLDLWRGLVPSLILILNPAINYTTFGLIKGETGM